MVVGDIQPLTRFNVTCIVEENGNRRVGSFGGGGRVEYGFFVDNKDYQRYAREAVRQAVLNLSAVDAPAGTMDVVLGPGWPGIFLHEAIGHGLEGDFNRKKTSAFTDRSASKSRPSFARSSTTARFQSRRGSINVDDEGTPTQSNGADRKGHSQRLSAGRLNAGLMKMPLTGNGRRESYRSYSDAAHDQYLHARRRVTRRRDNLRSVKKGLYAVSFGGGQVDITSGKFVFSASEAYLIEDGKVDQASQRRNFDRQRPGRVDPGVDGR